MNTPTRLFPILLLTLPAAGTLAADNPAVDTSDWKCKYCAFEEGSSGYIEGGVGSVSTDSYKFGEYNGLYQQGAYFVGNGELRVRGDDAYYMNLDAANLGLDTRSVAVDGGKQGRYRYRFSYDEIPHYISDSVSTPYVGVGSDTLTLPGWTPAANTGAMTTDLANSLHATNLDAIRKRLGLGVTLTTQAAWEFAVNVRHETRQGTQGTAGNFFMNTVQLVAPVDTVTDQIDASASYASRQWQVRFGYYGSLFANNNDSLTWDNPYLGVNTGQKALPPDNQFHQLFAAAGYSFSDSTRLTADAALGRMTQNQTYLAATTNPAYLPIALPANSLDGRVDTLDASAKLTSLLTSRVRLNASYAYNDHADKTPQAAYTWVVSDTNLSPTTRTNLPYSFTKQLAKLNGEYRFAGTTRASVGLDYGTLERTYQEVSKNKELTYWAKVSSRPVENSDISVKAAHGDRTVSNYEVLPWLSPAENPLLRKYNMADRTRDTVGVRADMYAFQVVNLGLGYDYANDDYSESQVGLTGSKDVTWTADASAPVTKNGSVRAYYTREKINSTQSGSYNVPTPEWTAENSDTIDTAGIGLLYAIIKSKLDAGVDYIVSNARGEQVVFSGAAVPPFPDIASRLAAVKLTARYHFSDKLSLNGTYWYQHFYSSDWHLDGVAPDTISNVLGFGEQSPSYYVNVLTLALRYRF